MTDLETVPDTDRDELAGFKLPAAESRLGATLLALYVDAGAYTPMGVPVQDLAQLTGAPRTSTASNCMVLRGRGLVSNAAPRDQRGGRYLLTDIGVAAVWRLYGTGPSDSDLAALVRRLGPVRHRPRRLVAPAEPSGA
jgi:hypothetical protein